MVGLEPTARDPQIRGIPSPIALRLRNPAVARESVLTNSRRRNGNLIDETLRVLLAGNPQFLVQYLLVLRGQRVA
jgi:hypothetical protein